MSKHRGKVQKLSHKDKKKREERNARRHRSAVIWEHHTVVKKRLDPLSALRERQANRKQEKIDKAIKEMQRLEDEA